MRNPDRETIFRFKCFAILNRLSAMKIGTDGVLLGAWAASEGKTANATEAVKSNPVSRILDVGCGTGVISLMMAQRFPQAEITGIEIEPMAAMEAAENFRRSPWADRLEVIAGDFTGENELISDHKKGHDHEKGYGDEKKYDLIVSNPPFFNNGELSPDTSRRQARHETTLTLEALIQTSCRRLIPEGKLSVVLPAGREPDLKDLCLQYGFSMSRLTRVSTVPSKPPRRILAEMISDPKKEIPLEECRLLIQDQTGAFSTDYRNLLKDFYLNF